MSSRPQEKGFVAAPHCFIAYVRRNDFTKSRVEGWACIRIGERTSDGLHYLNKFGGTALSRMTRRKPILTGPMSVQPTEHRSIKPAQSPPMVPANKGTSEAAPKKPSTRAEAQRAAKAEISRRNSLKRQRQAQNRF